MKRFLFAFLSVWLGVLLLAVAMPPSTTRGLYTTELAWTSVAMLILLPWFGAWGAVELIHNWRPRRDFAGRPRAGVRLVVAGALSSLLSVLSVAMIFAFLEFVPAQPFVLFGVSACWSAVACACLSRVRAARCRGCMYDLRAMPLGAPLRCPECGAKAA